MRLIQNHGKEIQYICPFPGCNDESGHLFVNKVKKVYHCFKCNRSGPISELEGIEVADVHMDISDIEKAINERYKKTTTDPKLPNDYTILEEGSLARKYIVDRGIAEWKIEEYKLGYTSIDNFKRIWFPDFNKNNDLIFWCMRTYLEGDTEKRWKFPPTRQFGIYKSNQLYGHYKLKNQDRVVVVEGLTDVLAGDIYYTATYGTGWTDTQAYMLSDLPAKEIIIMYDGDEGDGEYIKKGREKGIELAYKLAELRKGIRLAELPLKTDPGDFTSEELKAFEESSISVSNTKSFPFS